MKDWCKHMNAGAVWHINRPEFSNFDDWLFCPLCGTPRPPEQKKLAQVLFEAYQAQFEKPLAWNEITSKRIKAGSQAQAEAVVKLVEEICVSENSRIDILEKLEGML